MGRIQATSKGPALWPVLTVHVNSMEDSDVEASASFRISQSQGNRVLKSGGPFTRHSRFRGKRRECGNGGVCKADSIKIRLPWRQPGCFNCVPPIIPATHPSFPPSLSPAPIGERESIPPLTRLYHEDSRFHIHTRPKGPCAIPAPRARSGSGNPSRRSPVFPMRLVPNPDRGAGIHPAAHPSFP